MTTRILCAAGAATVLVALAAGAPAQAQEDYWSGFYLGANAGLVDGKTKMRVEATRGNGTIVIPPGDLAALNGVDDSNSKTGFTGGIEGGYNWVSGSLLFGIESDLDFFDVNQKETDTFTSVLQVNPPVTPAPSFTIHRRVTTDYLWTVRPRIGYASGPWLFFGSGGLAMTKVKFKSGYSDTRVPPILAEVDVSDTKTGWTVGAGGAYAFSPNLSVKAEYLYADFGKVHDTATSANGFVQLDSSAKVEANILRLGVDYRF